MFRANIDKMHIISVGFGLLFFQVNVFSTPGVIGTENAEYSENFEFGDRPQLNEDCIVNRTKRSGTCTWYNDCPIVLEEEKREIFPTWCSHLRFKELVVCCPKQEELVTKISIRAADKCQQYQQLCTSDSAPVNRKNGDADFREFPHAVVLGYINRSNSSEGIKYVCSGSVISENFILTAASCTEPGGNHTLKYVRLGDLDYISDEYNDAAQQFIVTKIFKHPHFHKKYNDIAILKLEHSLIFDEHIRPICLSSWEEDVPENLQVAGWGQIDYENGIHSHLQRVQQTLVPHEECCKHYADRITSRTLDRGIINETQLCAMAKQGEPDACQGFFGAALFSADRKQSCLHEMIGITSFGISCGVGQPGVYTRVEAFLDWIEDIVWNDGNGSTIFMPTPEPPITTETVPPIASRIHVQKCVEYQNTIENRVYNGNKTLCPMDLAVSDFIFGGEDAEPREFPHMALIGFENPNASNNISWQCGGTLISDQFVLTAAHCLKSREFGEAKVVLLGEYEYGDSTDDAEPVQLKIIEAIRHKNYSNHLKHHDIGLLRLESPVIFSDYVRPACLPESNSMDFDIIATGWGKKEDGNISRRLQKVKLDKFSNEQCNKEYAPIFNSGRFGISAGATNGKRDTCKGDSGGPLQTVHDKHACMYTIIGVTSFGSGTDCGTVVPGVYTRTYAYIDWIESIVWTN